MLVLELSRMVDGSIFWPRDEQDGDAEGAADCCETGDDSNSSGVTTLLLLLLLAL